MKNKKNVKNCLIKGFCAVFVGFICGFFGGGGGLVCVPTLKKVYHQPTKNAHATAIMIILPLSIISSVIYLLNNTFSPLVTLSVSVGVIAGGFIGAVFLKKLKTSVVEWIFIAILFTAGVRMIV